MYFIFISFFVFRYIQFMCNLNFILSVFLDFVIYFGYRFFFFLLIEFIEKFMGQYNWDQLQKGLIDKIKIQIKFFGYRFCYFDLKIQISFNFLSIILIIFLGILYVFFCYKYFVVVCVRKKKKKRGKMCCW